MSSVLDLPIRLLNGLVTLGISILLFRIYRVSKRRFYYLWSLGFLLYGVNIIVRIGSVPTMGQWIPAFLVLTGFISMIAGIAELVERRRLILVIFLLPISMALLFLYPAPENTLVTYLGWAVSIVPYLIITMSLIFIKQKYAKSIDLLIVGWSLLLFVNMAFPLDAMASFYIDFLAAFAKIIIFYGMTQPSFSLLAEDLKLFLIASVPKEYHDEIDGRFILVESDSGKKQQEIQWIVNRAQENERKGVGTIIVSMYDMISLTDITKYFDNNVIYMVRMIPGGRGSFNLSNEKAMTIDDNVNQLDLLFKDVIIFSNERKINAEIIIISMSSLIHTHGWRRVYSFLTSKRPVILSSHVRVTSLYYPKSHENPSDIIKIETLMDQIIKLD